MFFKSKSKIEKEEKIEYLSNRLKELQRNLSKAFNGYKINQAFRIIRTDFYGYYYLEKKPTKDGFYKELRELENYKIFEETGKYINVKISEIYSYELIDSSKEDTIKMLKDAVARTNRELNQLQK